MTGKESVMPNQQSDQVSSAKVSQYHAAQEEGDLNTDGDVDVTEDSMDFQSLLSEVSSNPAEPSAEAKIDGSITQKNLNISGVITRIRDEGPAGSRNKQTILSASKSDVKERGEEPPRLSGQAYGDLSTRMEDILQLVRETTKEQLVNRLDEIEQIQAHTGRGWLLPVLFLGLLVVGGYALYRTSNELALTKSNVLQLSSRLKKTEEKLGGLHRLVSDNTRQLQVLYTPDQLRTEMWIYQQQLQDDMRLQLGLLALSGRKASVAPTLMKDMPEVIGVMSESVVQMPPLKERKGKVKTKAEAKSGWNVYLASYSTQKQAKTMMARYLQRMPNLTIQPASVKGRKVYRVTVPGFSSKKEASRYLTEIKTEFSLMGSWIGRYVDKR